MYGIIKTRPDPVNVPNTILLVGETGVGKISILGLSANILHVNNFDHYNIDTLDHTNRQDGSNN